MRSMLIDAYIRKHVNRIIEILEKNKLAPTGSNGLIIGLQDEDRHELVVLWDQAYWTALQGTARGPFKDNISGEVLVSNARKIADETVRLFWGGLDRLV